MSIVYDKEFLSKILELEKTAQATTDVNSVAKKLVSKLEGELGGVSISSDNPAGAALKTENIQNLGKLLQFLDSNKINYNNQRVVYNKNELASLPENVQNILSPISINMSRDAASRKWNQADFYTNLNALVGYVGYLQKKSLDDKNPVLQVMTGKLVDQVNQIKPDSGLTRKPKSTPGQAVENTGLPGDTIVDKFGSKVFDIKNPHSDTGNLFLYAKNLTSKEALNAWLQQAPEAQVAMYDDKNQRSVFRYTDPSIDLNKAWNNIINTISARAQRLSQLAKSSDEGKKFNYYLTKLNEMGASVSSNTPSHSVPGTVPGSNQTQPQVNNQVNSNLNRAMSALPLSIREINLDDIQSFFRLVETIPTGERAARMQAYIADAETKINHLKRMMRYSDAIYPLGVAPKQFAARLKQPVGTYLAALDRLTEIVDLTRQVMAELYSSYGRQLSDNNANAVATLLGQIGRNRNDNSIYSRNIEDLNSLKAGINQVAKVS